MQKTNDAFSAYHPVVNFVFYIGAFLFGMILVHPIYLACSMILSGAYYVTIRGQTGLKYVLGMVPFFVLLSVINPLFNTLGDTVLFTWLDGRHYTLEALCYGMALAALFVSVLGWFASYNAVMTSDKFLYLFGRFAPSLSLVLTMVLRFVPTYQKRVIQIGSARKCIGKSGNDGTGREKAENGLTIVSALTSWALEGGIVTADSMRSRGFGSSSRTSFSIYRWERRDRILLFIMLLLIGGTAFCIFAGGTAAEYTPSLSITWNQYTVAGAIFYGVFLALPTIMNILEELTWRILKSRI